LLAVTSIAGPALAGVGDPRVGEPGCDGRIIAWFNQTSDIDGVPVTRGPGFFFRDGKVVKDAINDLARPNCDVV
jgi:hypothetical protein